MPADAERILRRLNSHGHRAYVVGGCVRDSLLGLTPKDWDICTSALPQEVEALFPDVHLVETGLKHGTVTLMLHHVPYEVTTFRVEGAYTDHRHPDSVTFVREVEEDLSRRDFTVNAMAYHPQEGLVDVFRGREDLEGRRIRCVGKPRERFGEDALRILRGLRFAACYGFSVEEETASAMREMAEDVRRVAGERIRVEMEKLLCGPQAESILRDYADVITAVFPSLRPMVGFAQHTRWHRWDVWEHSIRAVAAIAPEPLLRWVMLLHDAGKPAAFTLDEEGVGHACGHQQISARIAGELFDRMHFDNGTRNRALLLIERHDMKMSADPVLIRRQLNRFGEEAVRQLIAVHAADEKAKGTVCPEDADLRAREITEALDRILAESACFSLAALAVKGGDLIALGMRPGKRLGETLQRLLEAVMEDRVPNEREALLSLAGQLLDPTAEDPRERQEE